jgi:hypothetical protein
MSTLGVNTKSTYEVSQSPFERGYPGRGVWIVRYRAAAVLREVTPDAWVNIERGVKG